MKHLVTSVGLAVMFCISLMAGIIGYNHKMVGQMNREKWEHRSVMYAEQGSIKYSLIRMTPEAANALVDTQAKRALGIGGDVLDDKKAFPKGLDFIGFVNNGKIEYLVEDGDKGYQYDPDYVPYNMMWLVVKRDQAGQNVVSTK